MSAQTSPPPPRWPDEPPLAPPRRLTRLTDQGKVAGVAAGIGWYLGIDPVLVRIGLVVLTIATGAGIPAYIIAWVVLPEARSTDTAMPPPPRQRDGRSLAVLGIAIIAAIILLGQIDVFSGQVLTAAVLIGIGVLLFSDGDRVRTPTRSAMAPPPPPVSTAPPPPPPPDAAQAPVAPPVHSPPVHAPPVEQPPAPAGPPGGRQSAYGPYAGAWTDPRGSGDGRPPRPERPRSILGLLGFGAWLATMGTSVLLDRLGVVHLTPVAGVGLTLAVIGGTLLVGTLFGRARGLIGLGIAASLVLVPLSALAATGVDLDSGFGERIHAPTTVEAIRDYEIVAGAQTIDLTGIDLEGQTVPVTASMVAGELQVQVPEDVTVVVTGSLTAGERTLFGETLGGTDLPMTAAHDGVEGRGRIELDLSVIFGEVVVETVPVPAETRPR